MKHHNTTKLKAFITMKKAVSLFLVLMILFSTAMLCGITANAAGLSVKYAAHVSQIGWQPYVGSGTTAGTTGRALQLEAIKIQLVDGAGKNIIMYRAHVSGTGWQTWKKSNEVAGTTGQNRALEAIQIKLNAPYSKNYDVVYRVHVAAVGWLSWAKNGASAGSEGLSLRAEAIQIKVVSKDAGKKYTGLAFLEKPAIEYTTYSLNKGWLNPVSEGSVGGTTNQALSVEAIKINMKDFSGNSGVTYRTHVSGYGWQSWKTSGKVSGTINQSRSIEAITIQLSSSLALYFDIYYRVHVSNYGWLGWAKNGENAGSTGYKTPIEAIQIRLSFKGRAFQRCGDPFFDNNVRDYDRKVNDFINNPTWANGSYWGDNNGPSLSNWRSSGCCAYAADFAKSVCGANNQRSGNPFWTPDEIQSGDIIYLNEPHWLVVLYRRGSVLITAEGNCSQHVRISSSVYRVSDNVLYRDGNPVYSFAEGYHNIVI